ncbi:MAG: hypothetical protein ACTHOK_20645 [Nocardioidaceae bacterium]
MVHASARRRLAVAAAGLALVAGGGALKVASATAVVGGTADDAGRYAYVGSLVLALPDGSRRAWCTGTVVDLAPGAPVREGLLTSGRCLQRSERLAAFPGSRLLGMTVAAKVSRQPGQLLYRGAALVHPGYPGRRRAYDVGVYLLPPGVSPVPDGARRPRLPYVGQLGDLSDRGALIGAPATLVGYGGRRAFGSGSVSGLSKLRLQLAPRGDGPCLGDAGAPMLLPGAGSHRRPLLAGVTGAAPTRCRPGAPALRLDRPEVLAWLATVPLLDASS